VKYAAWRLLQTIRARQGMEYGKVVQKLLALAFLEAGAERATDRAIQGVDLEVLVDNRQLAVEVKTCEHSSFVISAKDIAGLEARRVQGCATYLAVLGGRRTDEWMFLPVPGTDLRIGSPMSLTMLRPFVDSDLDELVRDPFAEVVDRFGPLAAAEGQAGLNAVLEADERYLRA